MSYPQDLLGRQWKPNDLKLVQKGASPSKVRYATNEVLSRQPDQVNISRKEQRDEMDYRRSTSSKKDVPHHQTRGKRDLLQSGTRFGKGKTMLGGGKSSWIRKLVNQITGSPLS